MRIRIFSAAAVFGILFCGSGQEVIVHADAPYAASELQHHLQLITGRSIPVIPEAKYDGK